MKYLGAYVFRVAISDARIQAYDGTAGDLPVSESRLSQVAAYAR